MSTNAWLQVIGYLALVTGGAIPLGAFMARVFSGEAKWAQRVLGPVERVVYKVGGVDPKYHMSTRDYAFSLLGFSLVGTLFLYALMRLQSWLPLNGAGLDAVPTGVAFNTAISFVTNTNWQAYYGEATMSHLSQMLGLTVQNFVSAATGLAAMVALIRGIKSKNATTIGNFWVDLVRATVYILLPLSLVLAITLVSQGTPQTFNAKTSVSTLEGAPQDIALGPVASQVAIKQLGTNGGGYYNVNSAHPLENPTPLSNLLQMLALLLIPAACCFTFGQMIGDKRQGMALYATMLVIFIPLLIATVVFEEAGNPKLPVAGSNMEGKELRFGAVGSAIWAVATTAASNGSVNSMHDSFTPLGGLIPMWLIQLGEVIFGGVGSGLYGLLMYAIIAVFLAGLMVGRTPEYLGKKIEVFEMKMASLVVLIPGACVLVGTALACVIKEGTAPLGNPGAHGFSEMLYAFSSGANNNGSAFGGLTASGPFYVTAIGISMWLGRFWVIIPVLAIAGSLAKKKIVPANAGTLPTHSGLFIVLLAGTVVLVGALTFIPALALGPIVEHLQLVARTP